MKLNLSDDFSQDRMFLEAYGYKILSPSKAVKYVGKGFFCLETDQAENPMISYWFPNGIGEPILWDSDFIKTSLHEICELEDMLFYYSIFSPGKAFFLQTAL